MVCLVLIIWLPFRPRRDEITLIKERYSKILETVESMKNTINCHSRSVSSDTTTICCNIRELKKSIQELTIQINELDKRIIANDNVSQFIGDEVTFDDNNDFDGKQ